MLEHLVILFAILGWTAVNILEYNYAYEIHDPYNNNTTVFNLTDLNSFGWNI